MAFADIIHDSCDTRHTSKCSILHKCMYTLCRLVFTILSPTEVHKWQIIFASSHCTVCFCIRIHTHTHTHTLTRMVVTALYGSSMSGSSFDYVSYIYLLAPVSLAIINPIGFCLMEYNKQATKRKLQMKQVSITENSHSHQSHHLRVFWYLLQCTVEGTYQYLWNFCDSNINQ